ncbi:MAG: hypothetical protein LBB19_00630 [Puniceicoccales bacterium]|jgi:hypothetical protein|nr:hypothetical protein [Puniceicoccales bacterium]
MKWYPMFSYLVFNLLIHTVCTWTSETINICLFVDGWFVTSAIYGLSLLNGIPVTILLGLYLDADTYSQPFGISACLLCTSFICLKQHFIQNTCLHHPHRFVAILNTLLQIFLLLGIIGYQKAPLKTLGYQWPSLILSFIFLFYTTRILIWIQRRWFLRSCSL